MNSKFKNAAIIVYLILSILPLKSEADEKRILFLAGEPSHGWNAHEFIEGNKQLAAGLNESQLQVNSIVSHSWPNDPADLKELAAVVIYSDGEDLHVAKGQTETLKDLHNQGVGIVVIHYALEGADQAMNEFYLDSIGGYFEVDWSVNPKWKPKQVELAEHPITSGVSQFSTDDEWYFHMRFRKGMEGVTPILSTNPTEKVLGADGPRSGNPILRDELKKGLPQHLAWIAENPGKGRGFAITAGHFHHNWAQNDFRKLVLNAIAWAAGIDVPNNGVNSTAPNIIRYQTISEAIARNDLNDIKQHLKRTPETINILSKRKMTPLHEAIMRKRPEASIMLLENGGDPNTTTSRSQTAMHLAIDRDLPSVAKAILKLGVDLGVRDSQGWTALHLAAAKNRNEIAKMLIDGGADLKRLSAAGGTPLHEAAVGGDADLLQVLIEAGVDPKVISDHNKSALDIAKEYENEIAVKILENL